MPKIEVEKLVAFTHMQYRFISFVLLRWFAFYLHAIKVLNYFMTIWVKFKRFFFSLHFFVHRRLINHKMTGEMFAIFVCFVFFFLLKHECVCVCCRQSASSHLKKMIEKWNRNWILIICVIQPDWKEKVNAIKFFSLFSQRKYHQSGGCSMLQKL